MTAKDSLRKNENPKGSHHISDHTKVYFDLEATGLGNTEVCQIAAHFADNSFSRYIYPMGSFTASAAKLTRLSKEDGILYLEGEPVETVSKMDAWKDFLKFLQSANNSVILVMHNRHFDCFLLFRDLSELSLLEEFRKVCVGVIDTLPLCRKIFRGRYKMGKTFRLEDLVKDKLGKEISAGSHNAVADAINLEKLMKQAKVQPKVFQQYFFPLSEVEHPVEKNVKQRKRTKEAKRTANANKSSSVEGGEDSGGLLLSGRVKTTNSKANTAKTTAITQNVSKQDVAGLIYNDNRSSNLNGEVDSGALLLSAIEKAAKPKSKRKKRSTITQNVSNKDVAGIIFNDNKSSSMEGGEGNGASLVSGSIKASKPKANRKKSNAITPDVSKEVAGRTVKDSFQNNKDTNASHHITNHTKVYLTLEEMGSGKHSEVWQIGAHFAESTFSRYVLPIRTFGKRAQKLLRYSEEDGILYQKEERVAIALKMDAWKDFLKYLRTANNSVVLVIHDKNNNCFLLFRDLSELSLMEEFREVCVGVIDTFPLCKSIFPGRDKIGKNYKLKELVQDKLGVKHPSGHHNATLDAINLDKLMKHANVKPKAFQQHFLSLSKLENRYQENKKQNKSAKRAYRTGIIFNRNKNIYLEGGAKRKTSSAITVDVSKQVKKTTAKDSLQNNENSNSSYRFPDHRKVYFDLTIRGLGKDSEVCHIEAHYGEKNFSRYVYPRSEFLQSVANQTKLSKNDIPYLEGERVKTVSKNEAWKDFLQFLQSANKKVILVSIDRSFDCFFLFRDLSGLSLMDEFRKVCIGVIDSCLLCQTIFPGRKEIGKTYRVRELFQEKLGIKNSSAVTRTINLEKLMKHANVKPATFRQHFLSLSTLENQYQENRKQRNQSKSADSSASLLSGSVKARKPEANRKTSSAITVDVSKQVEKTTAKDSLQNNENSNISYQFPDHRKVYFDLETTSFGKDSEVCHIVAHYGEKNFSRYVYPRSEFVQSVANQTKLSKKDGILYLEGERVKTVSKKEALKDFLQFLQSANKKVILVTHDKNYCFLLFRDLSGLSLMDEFRKVCVGGIDTLPLCQTIFPGRKEDGKNYRLKGLLQEKLGIQSSSAITHTINLEKLMKHANVNPETFRQHFLSLSKLENQYQEDRKRRKQNKSRKRAYRTGKFFNRNKSIHVERGEVSGASLVSGSVKAIKPEANRKECSAITLDVNKKGEMMPAKDSLQNSKNPNVGHHLPNHTMVYFDLEGTGSGTFTEVCQIGAYFAKKCFSRYICPIGRFTIQAALLTGFSKKDGILYLDGKQVETVSKMDAWKDFLQFLQSANNSVVLVTHDRHNDCFLLFRDLSEFSLMEKFRQVCVGVIDTLPLCQTIFPGRKEIGKNYRLEDIVQDKLGEENSAGSHNAIIDAINLEKLMKHAKVQPEVYQQHFYSLSDLEYWYLKIREARLLWDMFPFLSFHGAKKMAEAGITSAGLERSYVKGGEDGIASFLSDKITDPKAFKERTIAITQVLRKSEARRLLRLGKRQP